MTNPFERQLSISSEIIKPTVRKEKTAEASGVKEAGEVDFFGLKLQAKDVELIDQAINYYGLPENTLNWARGMKDEKEIKKIIGILQVYLQAPAEERRTKGTELARALDDIE